MDQTSETMPQTLEQVAQMGKAVPAASVKKLQDISENMLPCEQSAFEKLTKQIGGRLDHYKAIDLPAVLKSMKKQPNIPFPVPRFAAMDVTEERLLLSSDSDGNQLVPDGLEEAYKPLLDIMEKLAWRNLLATSVKPLICALGILAPTILIGLQVGFSHWMLINAATMVLAIIFGFMYYSEARHTISISTALNGLLPADAREAIRQNKGKFDKIYILAEAPEWKMNVDVYIQKDPLIIGKKDDYYYILHQFDLTPLERWAEIEFSSTPPKAEQQKE